MLKQETRDGITLIALIITIIILVILAAVSINAAYNSGIVNYAVNGTGNYIEGAKKESNSIENLENSFGKVMNRIEAITSNIYVKLYDYGTTDDYEEKLNEGTENEETVTRDGYTLVFSRYNADIEGVTKIKDYGDIQYKEFTIDTSNNIYDVPWYNERVNITKVIIADKITPLNTGFWFYYFSNLTTIENIENLDTSYVTSMSSMFRGCTSLTSLDVSHFNTENVTGMNNMFTNCTGLTTLDVSKFNTTNVTDMISMFYNCTGLTTLDVSKFDTTNVTKMSSMFRGCSSLKTIGTIENTIDLSYFKTSNLLDMSCLFYGCRSITKINFGNINTSSVQNMNYMFISCSKLSELDLSSFNTSNVESMSYMFSGCTNLTKIYVGDNWTTNSVSKSTKMFYNCNALEGGHGTTFEMTSSVVDKTYACIDTAVYDENHVLISGNQGYLTHISEQEEL